MDFFEAVKNRRSIRKFTSQAVSKEIMQKSFDMAMLAPNSSNTQTWNFLWVTSNKKEKLIEVSGSNITILNFEKLSKLKN